CLILVFLVVIVHLVSDCTHLTRCPKLLVRIKYTDASGKEQFWTGQGRTPSIIQKSLDNGKSLDDFLI
ncbi:H-NS family nucleoid-associated regulatory protein, partial [Vibrio cincinnatiensis]